MTDVLAIGLQGMQRDMAHLERISMNIANATTPGYKREIFSAAPSNANGRSFADIVGRGAADARRQMDGVDQSSPKLGFEVLHDLRPGSLKSTGQRLDVALAGDGYFEVRTAQGLAYSRDGSLHLDPRGRLVNAQGDAVMGHGGEIVLNQPDPFIDASGRVFERRIDGGMEAMPVAQIKVVKFADPQALHRIGNGLWQTDQMPEQITAGDGRIQQGFIENSNVNSMREMVQMMETMRHFESLQKVALSYDDMVGMAVRKLGESA